MDYGNPGLTFRSGGEWWFPEEAGDAWESVLVTGDVLCALGGNVV